MKAADAAWHGTAGGYTNHRCRCRPCRDAQTAAVMRRRAVRRLDGPDDVRHGSTNGYQNYGCRCTACTAAATRAKREWYARNRAKT